MKRSEHHCATPDCLNSCPREYPFCAYCWRRVPKELREEVRRELSKRQTPDLDRSALYYAVTRAAASVRESGEQTPSVSSWESAYSRAGGPGL